jgi:hypothetical protein
VRAHQALNPWPILFFLCVPSPPPPPPCSLHTPLPPLPQKAKANGGHVPHFPKNYRPPQYDPYWGYGPYDPYAAYAHHYPHLAPMPHPHLQGPLGLLPPPGVPLAHFAPYPLPAAVAHPAQVALAAAANNSVRVVRRSAARRSTLADTQGETPASSSAPGSPAIGSPPSMMRHCDQSFSGPGSPLVTRGTAGEGDLEAAAAAAMSATKQHPQQRRGGPLGGSGSPGGGGSERGGEARRPARSSSPAGSDSSLWFALLEVVQEESEGPSPRRKRAASEMEVSCWEGGWGACCACLGVGMRCVAIGVGVLVQVAWMGGVCGTSCCLCMHSMG